MVSRQRQGSSIECNSGFASDDIVAPVEANENVERTTLQCLKLSHEYVDLSVKWSIGPHAHDI